MIKTAFKGIVLAVTFYMGINAPAIAIDHFKEFVGYLAQGPSETLDQVCWNLCRSKYKNVIGQAHEKDPTNCPVKKGLMGGMPIACFCDYGD